VECPGHEAFVALLEGRLSEPEAESIDDHMDCCDDCRSLVAGLARGGVVATASAPPEPEPEDGPADRPLITGDLVAGRFEILRRVGTGAMGVVYEALDRTLGVRIALKALRPHAAASAALVERLRREIVLGRRITHPNVCRLHDLGDWEGLRFITMEFVEGETLAARMARGRLPEREALQVLAGICEALEAAHAESVVHRDLKPANVMVGEDGRVSVMDFGLARDLREDRSVEGALVGTPAYWAPEQARGQRATERSDLYALGLIACELLGGVRPSWGDPVPPGVPARLRAAIGRCLVTEPTGRLASARELGVALAPPLPRRRRRLAGFGAAAAAAALALVAAIFWRADAPAAMREARARPELVQAVAATAPAATKPPLTAKVAPAPPSEPDVRAAPRPRRTPRAGSAPAGTAPSIASPATAPAQAGPQWFFFE